MKTSVTLRTCVTAFSVLGLTLVSATADDTVGVARISDRGTQAASVNLSTHAPRQLAVQPVSWHSGGCTSGYCGPEGCNGYMSGYSQRMGCLLNGRRYHSGYNNCNNCNNNCNDCNDRNCLSGFWHNQSLAYQSRNARVSEHLFGWLVPSGCCGQGCPPCGKYNMVYAQNPNHFDQRDGGMWGAQGYGTHITVPIAPNVHQQYNYSWGVPSSRITHISHVAPYTRPRPLHW